MASIFGGLGDTLAKGLSSFMPQDDPDVKIFNAQNELSKLQEQEAAVFAEIGRQAYAQDPQAWPQHNKLQMIQSNIAAAQTSLNGLKADKEADEAAKAEQEAQAAKFDCPSCGTRNPEGTRFCQECGTALAIAAPAKEFCIGCGAQLPPGGRFCGACGARQA